MPNDVDLVSLIMACPHCQAEAMLTYTQAGEHVTEPHHHDVIYLCPNMCALPSGEVTALIGDDRA